MENLDRRLLLAGLGLVGAAAAASASAGTLNPPPGPVAPTGKTTDEIEPRISVQSLSGDANNSYIISQPGSYYLAGNIHGAGGKHGISIEADGVTLDLGGFALIGEATGTAIGINVPAPRSSLCVRNGTIREWRSHGVSAQAASGSLLERLRASLNIGDGLRIGGESAVRDCVMYGNTGNGLFSNDRALVSGCVADVNSGSGMALGSDVQVIDCLVSRSLGAAKGIVVGARSTVSRCTVSRNAGTGIQVGPGSTIADCTVSWNGGSGIVGSDRCHIARNTCDLNSVNGIDAYGTGSRIDGNNCTNGQMGIFVEAANNLVVRNSVSGNSLATFGFIGGGTGVATIINVSNTAGFSSDQPWANFSF